MASAFEIATILKRPKIFPLSELAILLQWESIISPVLHQQMLSVAKDLSIRFKDDLVEVVPAFHSLCLVLKDVVNPLDFNQQLLDFFDSNYQNTSKSMFMVEQDEPIQIAVKYGGKYGPDLVDLARAKNVSVEEIVDQHTKSEYYVYLIGFIGGFPYLGGLAESLHTPRRSIPRTRVPAGSVGIGGEQSGIYPVEAPGGWHIIGNTDFKLFDKEKKAFSRLKAGDRVRFICEGIWA